MINHLGEIPKFFFGSELRLFNAFRARFTYFYKWWIKKRHLLKLQSWKFRLHQFMANNSRLHNSCRFVERCSLTWLGISWRVGKRKKSNSYKSCNEKTVLRLVMMMYGWLASDQNSLILKGKGKKAVIFFLPTSFWFDAFVKRTTRWSIQMSKHIIKVNLNESCNDDETVR